MSNKIDKILPSTPLARTEFEKLGTKIQPNKEKTLEEDIGA